MIRRTEHEKKKLRITLFSLFLCLPLHDYEEGVTRTKLMSVILFYKVRILSDKCLFSFLISLSELHVVSNGLFT